VEIHEYLHSFTLAVVDNEDIAEEISNKISHFHEEPGWRNWQTQRTQNPPVLSTLGVRLPLPAPAKPLQVFAVFAPQLVQGTSLRTHARALYAPNPVEVET
jgi:hypothetical protein